jgi:alpha-galactosidase
MKRRSFLSTSIIGAGGFFVKSSSESSAIFVDERKKKFDLSSMAPKPPLGWNSFNSYGVYLHHDAAIANLKAMAEKLKPYGYEYFVIDGGWHGEFKLVEGTLFPREKHADEVHLNEFGIPQPSKTYFGKGFKPIVDYTHKLGLKIGLHLMRGISRKAVDLNLPIKNSKYRAADIADKSSICTWNSQNYGIDSSKPGAQDYYDSVFAQMADWEIDFVKVDDLTPYPKEIILVADAIEKCGRKMIYSLSPGGPNYLPELPYYKRANLIRTSTDIWDRQDDINKGFESWKLYQGLAHKGFWPDLDMIPFGQLQLMSPKRYETGDKNVQLAGFGNTRVCSFSLAQMRTFITMRSLAASPIFIGGDLPTMDEYSLSLLTNKEMLACNQNGECAINVYIQNGIEVWIANEKNKPSHGWIGVFNRNNSPVTTNLSKKELGLLIFANGYKHLVNENSFEMKDIWNNKQISFKEGNVSSNLDANDVLFIRYDEQLTV